MSSTIRSLAYSGKALVTRDTFDKMKADEAKVKESIAALNRAIDHLQRLQSKVRHPDLKQATDVAIKDAFQLRGSLAHLEETIHQRYAAAEAALRTSKAVAYETSSKLPEFKGWTVDLRLREFRKVDWRGGAPSMETRTFDSDVGDAMLADFLKTPLGSRLAREGKIQF